MRLNNRDFVECAYLTILNRAADQAGLVHYMERLRAGHPRLAILSALYASAEARESMVRIPWLGRAIFLYRLTDLPVIRLFRTAVQGRDWRFEYEHRLSVLEHAVASLGSPTTSRLPDLGELLVTLREITAKAAADESADEKKTDAGLSGQTLVAKRVYKELLDALESAGKSPLDCN